jgi:hypothetical protein
MPLIDDEEVIHTLLPYAVHPPLGIGIGVRRTIWREYDFQTLERQTPHQSWKETSRHDQPHKAYPLPCILLLPHQLPRQLASREVAASVHGTARQMNATGADLDKEEHIHRFQL